MFVVLAYVCLCVCLCLFMFVCYICLFFVPFVCCFYLRLCLFVMLLRLLCLLRFPHLSVRLFDTFCRYFLSFLLLVCVTSAPVSSWLPLLLWFILFFCLSSIFSSLEIFFFFIIFFPFLLFRFLYPSLSSSRRIDFFIPLSFFSLFSCSYFFFISSVLLLRFFLYLLRILLFLFLHLLCLGLPRLLLSLILPLPIFSSSPLAFSNTIISLLLQHSSTSNIAFSCSLL